MGKLEMANRKDEDFYAITITINDLSCMKTPKKQFVGTIAHLLRVLNESTDFEITPEWRITNGSIHYHGTIIINDKIKWLKSTLPKLKRIGFIKIKKIDELQGWMQYCDKEITIAEKILHPLKFPLKNSIIQHTDKLTIIDDEVVKEKCECVKCLLQVKNVN